MSLLLFLLLDAKFTKYKLFKDIAIELKVFLIE